MSYFSGIQLQNETSLQPLGLIIIWSSSSSVPVVSLYSQCPFDIYNSSCVLSSRSFYSIALCNQCNHYHLYSIISHRRFRDHNFYYFIDNICSLVFYTFAASHGFFYLCSMNPSLVIATLCPTASDL